MAALYVANAGGTLTAKAAQIANSGAGGSTTLAEKSIQSLTWEANISSDSSRKRDLKVK
ncbi:hypothetical protein [Herbaspirillum sp. NPDC087042]|uniref:hypothetical protein n=1 Tax=Herbaspirillum sp. NPDC087042 TaxID=3364004 RepID=UPI003817B877